MTPARRPRSRPRFLRLLPAAAFALVLALVAGDAMASPSADEHAAACHCGVKCRREACCCGPRKKAESPPATDSEPPASPVPDLDPEPVEEPAGPCLAAIPGGDDVAAPVKLAPARVGDAACAGLDPCGGDGRRDRLPPPSSDRPLPGDGSRLDRPPKADPSA